MGADNISRAAGAIDPGARRAITMLRAKIAEIEGRGAPAMLPQGERFADIVTAVAAEFGTTREHLMGESRDAGVVLARWAAMTLAHRLLGYSTPRIGRLLRRDHTTVLHGIRRIAALAEDQPDLAARLDRLAKTINRKQKRIAA
jgi:chromosomal replication initiation ATPase DnaA